MSTKRKNTQESFNYDMIQRPKAQIKLVASNDTGESAEEESRRLLRFMAYMGLEKIRCKVADHLDWYNIQLRLHVGERMVLLMERTLDGISEDDMAEFKAIAEEGILAHNAIARRINNGETTEIYVTPEESKKIELALNLSEEADDALTDFFGKLVVFKLYRDTKDHLIGKNG